MRKLATVVAAITSIWLVAMVVVSVVTGATQEPHEHFALPEAYAASLLEHPNALRLVFAMDVAFLALYTAFFAAFAAYLRERGRPFAYLALGFMITCAGLDIVEDHHIVAMLDAAERGVLPSQDSISMQVVISAAKFSTSYVSLVLFGLAIPRTTKLGWALCLFLTAGTLASAVIGYAMPQAQMVAFDNVRGLSFLVGFGLALAWLVKEKD
jgi:hypothetical protein